MFKSEKTKRIAIISGVAFVVIYAILYLMIQAGFSADRFSSVGKTISSVFSPIVAGGLIAYLLNPCLRFFETKIFKKLSKPRLRRALSLILTYVLVLLMLIGLFSAILPSIVSSVQEFGSNIENYVSALQTTLSGIFDDLNHYIDEHPSIRNLLENMGIYDWMGHIIEEDAASGGDVSGTLPDAPESEDPIGDTDDALTGVGTEDAPPADTDKEIDGTDDGSSTATDGSTDEATDDVTDGTGDGNDSTADEDTDGVTPDTEGDDVTEPIGTEDVSADASLSETEQEPDESLNLSQKHELSFEAFTKFIIEKISEIAASFSAGITDLADYLLDFGFSFLNFLKNIILGLFISIYLLASKERVSAQWKRFISAIFPQKTADNILRIARRSDRTAGRFILGTIIDAIIVAVVTLILLSIFDIKYPLLIAIIIGFTNMIPFFGPFIGAIPSALLLLIDDITVIVNNPDAPARFTCITFILLMLIIQQIDGNIINPRVIGNSTGLSSLGVILSVTIMSGFFGFFGMLLGVPVAAIFISIGKEFLEYLLKKKKLPTALAAYYSEHSLIPPETPEEELESHEHTAFYRWMMSVHEKLRHFFRKILYRNHGQSRSLKMWVKMKLGVRNVKHKVSHTLHPDSHAKAAEEPTPTDVTKDEDDNDDEDDDDGDLPS